MRMYGATRLGPGQAPSLSAALLELSQRAGLSEVPDLYYLPSSMVNAFTVGRRREAAIAVTDGLLRTLDIRELTGVVAHEVSHIRNNDIWVMGVADLFSRLTSLLSLFGQFLLFFIVSVRDLQFGIVQYQKAALNPPAHGFQWREIL